MAQALALSHSRSSLPAMHSTGPAILSTGIVARSRTAGDAAAYDALNVSRNETAPPPAKACPTAMSATRSEGMYATGAPPALHDDVSPLPSKARSNQT